MKKTIITLAAAGFFGITAFTPAGHPAEEQSGSQTGTKLVTKSGHISFFSHTVAEDITANNYKVVSTLNPSSGEVVFSVPMQSFEFEKALMQKHYNSPKFLDTKTYPKAKFKGNITNLSDINFSKDGTYNVNVSGELTLHGVTKPITDKGAVTVKGNKITVDVKMKITLADYNIAFEKGKPSTNIAETIDITVKVEYNSKK